LLKEMPVLNMLNTRYIILHPEISPVKNPYAMGSAWLLSNLEFVHSYSAEINELRTVDLKSTAIVHKEFAEYLQDYALGESTAQDTIYQTSYQPDQLTFEASIANAQLAVFSEIYYPKGWKVFVNGKEEEIIRVDYLLRGVILPAGISTIEFMFEPTSYKVGKLLATAGSVLILLLIVGFFVQRKRLLLEQE